MNWKSTLFFFILCTTFSSEYSNMVKLPQKLPFWLETQCMQNERINEKKYKYMSEKFMLAKAQISIFIAQHNIAKSHNQ